MGMSLIMSLIFLEILLSICLKFPPKIAVHTVFASCLKREHERERKVHDHEVGAKLTGGGHHHPFSLHIASGTPCTGSMMMIKEWKKEQSSCCCTADVCLRQSVNQLYNNQKMDKLVLFSTACDCVHHFLCRFRAPCNTGTTASDCS